jgi:hypothetical protein
MSATKIQLSFFSSSNLLAWISYPWKRYQTLSNLTYLVRWFINLQWIAKLTLALCKTAFFNLMLMSFTLVNFLYCFSWFFFLKTTTHSIRSQSRFSYMQSAHAICLFFLQYMHFYTLSHTLFHDVCKFLYFLFDMCLVFLGKVIVENKKKIMLLFHKYFSFMVFYMFCVKTKH